MKKSLPKKKPTGKWFIAIRGSYLPVSWQGWLLHALFVVYLVMSAIIIIKNNTSLLPAALEILVQWVMAAVVVTWIAQRKT